MYVILSYSFRKPLFNKTSCLNRKYFIHHLLRYMYDILIETLSIIKPLPGSTKNVLVGVLK